MSDLDYVPDIVKNAMLTAWNEICADTGCHPLDIEHRGRELFFTPQHWAKFTGDIVRTQIEKLLAALKPDPAHDPKVLRAGIERILRHTAEGGGVDECIYCSTVEYLCTKLLAGEAIDG